MGISVDPKGSKTPGPVVRLQGIREPWDPREHASKNQGVRGVRHCGSKWNPQEEAEGRRSYNTRQGVSVELGTSSALVFSGAWGPPQMMCILPRPCTLSVGVHCLCLGFSIALKRGIRDLLPRGPTEGMLWQVEKWSQSQGGQRGLGKWKSKWV